MVNYAEKKITQFFTLEIVNTSLNCFCWKQVVSKSGALLELVLSACFPHKLISYYDF